MIRTCITTGITGRRARIRRGNRACISREGRIRIIRIDRDLPTGRVPGHILVHDRQNRFAGGFVVGEDGLGAEEAALFAGVEVELQGVAGAETGGGEDA